MSDSKTRKQIFLDSLNAEIDRKIQLIDAGKMEPVPRMKKSDYILALVLILASFISMIVVFAGL